MTVDAAGSAMRVARGPMFIIYNPVSGSGAYGRLRVCVPQCTVLLLPGNHDLPLFNLPLRLLDPYRGFRKAFGRHLETVHEDPRFHLQLLNTCSRWRHTDSEVSARQADAVVERLPAWRPKQLRLVVTHQPAAVVRDQDAPDRLRGGEAALRRWSGRGVDMVLGGHIHLPYLCRSSGIWVVQAGTAVSRRDRPEAGNSFNVTHPVEVSDAGTRCCRVERWDHSRDADRAQAFHLRRRYHLDLSTQPC